MAQSTIEQKETYLDILAVFHYVNGALAALVGLAGLAFMGIGMGAASEWGRNWEMEPTCAITIGIVFVLIFVGGYAALNLLTGRALQTRNHYALSLVTSAFNCLNMPLGSLLGIFTLVLLSDREVRALFHGGQPASVQPAGPGGSESQPPAPPVE